MSVGKNGMLKNKFSVRQKICSKRRLMRGMRKWISRVKKTLESSKLSRLRTTLGSLNSRSSNKKKPFESSSEKSSDSMRLKSRSSCSWGRCKTRLPGVRRARTHELMLSGQRLACATFSILVTKSSMTPSSRPFFATLNRSSHQKQQRWPRKSLMRFARHSSDVLRSWASVNGM